MNRQQLKQILADPYVVVLSLILIAASVGIVIGLHMEYCGRWFCGMDSI